MLVAQRIRFGTISVDRITMAEAVDVIEATVHARNGGFVVTPNVDHVVLAERDLQFRAAYRCACLSLVDGMPLVWISRMLRCPLPEKISGSDLIYPLMKRAAVCGIRVYLFGAAPRVGEKAASILMCSVPGLQIVGVDSPIFGFENSPSLEGAAIDKMTAVRPDLILVALGAPKQELLMHRWYKRGIKQVMIGIGAGLDFVTGRQIRAPRWISNAGLEWLYRLAREPRRLARRYLVRDMSFLPVLYRMMTTRRVDILVPD
jgi:N-acetylglucosaminyldiphosphoundecaprenol N-acetyl-beta-D-mannosaminyltransferase